MNVCLLSVFVPDSQNHVDKVDDGDGWMSLSHMSFLICLMSFGTRPRKA